MTERDRVFLVLHEETGDIRASAIKAGFPEATALQAGQRVLKKKKDSALVRADPKPEVTVVEPLMTAEYLMLKYQSIINFSLKDVADVVDGEVVFKPLSEWSDDSARSIDWVKSTVGRKPDGTSLTMTEYKFCDRQKAMDKLGQYHGIWAGFDQLVSGLKAYGIELVRDGDMFMIKEQK